MWDRVVKVTCHNNCSYQKPCILHAYVKDGAVVRLEQGNGHPVSRDPDLPDWNPRGCQKGLVSYRHDARRILYPFKRAGERGGGNWQRVSWEEALNEIADKLIDVIASDGVEAIVRFPGSGTLGSESAGFEALMDALGVPYAPATNELGDEHLGAALVFGQPFVGGSVDNWWYSDLILIWGGNPAYTNISNFHLLTEARYNGARIVCIAPDYSASAVHADLWVPLNIGSDAALALSMCEVIVSERLFNEDFVREQTDLSLLVRTDNGKFLREGDLRRGGRDDLYYFWDLKSGKLTAAPWNSLTLGDAVPALEGRFRVAGSNGEIEVRPVFELLGEHLRAYTPEAAARVTGVCADTIRTVARQIARARAVSNVSTFNWGKFYNGHEIERAIILLVALCGQMGRKGAVYNAYTGLAADTLAPGGLVSGWLLLRAAASTDPRYAQWKSQGYTDEMIILEYARDATAKRRINPSSLFHYFHSGLLELSARNQSWDPSLKRPLQSYVEEALGKGWHHIWPSPDRTPKAVIQFGGSIVHRLRATEHALKTLLPKLELLVTVDTRWGSTALYSDYVLPAAGWYEKFSFYGPLKIDYPYGFIINKAEEPLGESKGEWEIACLVARKIEERAKARGLTSFLHPDGSTRRLDNLHTKVTANGLYDDADEEGVTRDYYLNTSNVEQLDWEEAKEKGLVAVTGLGLTARSIGNACDVSPGEPLVPLTWHTVKKEPYPTQTRRMQFYLDHDWYLEFGEELPVQKEDPKAGGNYPLRVTGGHARWSVHSCQTDHALLLRLQRGEPLIFVSRADASARGIGDGDEVKVYNDVAAFQCAAAVSAAVRPGQLLIYHAWENFQFPGWRHFKSVMASPMNPLELAGGYYHLQSTSESFHPGLSDRETRVELKRVA